MKAVSRGRGLVHLYCSQTVKADATIFSLQCAADLHSIVCDDCLVRACVVRCAADSETEKSFWT